MLESTPVSQMQNGLRTMTQDVNSSGDKQYWQKRMPQSSLINLVASVALACLVVAYAVSLTLRVTASVVVNLTPLVLIRLTIGLPKSVQEALSLKAIGNHSFKTIAVTIGVASSITVGVANPEIHYNILVSLGIVVKTKDAVDEDSIKEWNQKREVLAEDIAQTRALLEAPKEEREDAAKEISELMKALENNSEDLSNKVNKLIGEMYSNPNFINENVTSLVLLYNLLLSNAELRYGKDNFIATNETDRIDNLSLVPMTRHPALKLYEKLRSIFSANSEDAAQTQVVKHEKSVSIGPSRSALLEKAAEYLDSMKSISSFSPDEVILLVDLDKILDRLIDKNLYKYNCNLAEKGIPKKKINIDMQLEQLLQNIIAKLQNEDRLSNAEIEISNRLGKKIKESLYGSSQANDESDNKAKNEAENSSEDSLRNSPRISDSSSDDSLGMEENTGDDSVNMEEESEEEHTMNAMAQLGAGKKLVSEESEVSAATLAARMFLVNPDLVD